MFTIPITISCDHFGCEKRETVPTEVEIEEILGKKVLLTKYVCLPEGWRNISFIGHGDRHACPDHPKVPR